MYCHIHKETRQTYLSRYYCLKPAPDQNCSVNQSLIQAAPLPVCELLLYKSFMCPPAIPLFKTLFQITIHPNFYFNIFSSWNAVLSRKPFFFLGVFPSLGTAPQGATKSTCVLKSMKVLPCSLGKKQNPRKKSFPEQPQSCQVTSQYSAFCSKSEHQVKDVLVNKTLAFRWRYLLTNWSQN